MYLKILNTPLQTMTNVLSRKQTVTRATTCEHWLAINTSKLAKTILKGDK